MSKPEAAIDYIVARLATSDVEVFGGMFLDTQMRMIAFEEMFRGTLTQTSVYPREVVKAAVRNDAYAIVIAHNHPSGSLQPSQADIALTRRLKESVGPVDVRLVDHIIAAAGQGHPHRRARPTRSGLTPFATSVRRALAAFRASAKRRTG